MNMIANIINRCRFQLIKRHSLRQLRSTSTFDRNSIYLTFDDGPEQDITEFILDELSKYNVKGTFFCCGENCEKHPELMRRIKEDGHGIANHTNSHINGFTSTASTYMENVDKCEKHLNTYTFRPPWGALTFKLYNKLRKKYRIVYWDVVSDDTKMRNFNIEEARKNMIENLKPGSIVLFHFCKKHENETKQILPMFLQYIKEKNYKTNKL